MTSICRLCISNVQCDKKTHKKIISTKFKSLLVIPNSAMTGLHRSIIYGVHLQGRCHGQTQSSKTDLSVLVHNRLIILCFAFQLCNAMSMRILF